MTTTRKLAATLLSLTLIFALSQFAIAGAPGRESGHMGGDPAAMMTEKLNLTAEQQAQVKAIFDATHAQSASIMDDSSLTPDARAAKMKELHEGAMAKVKAL